MKRVVILLIFLVVFGLAAGAITLPAIAAGTFPIIREEVSTGRWFVFYDPATQESCASCQKAGARLVHDLWLINAYSVEADEATAQLLRQRGFKVVPVGTTPLATGPELQMLGVDKAQQSGLKGNGVKIAVVDTGITTTTNVNPTVIYQKDWVENDALAQDDNGHGTAIAGIIAEVAPNAQYIIEKVCAGDQLCLDDRIIAGIQDAVLQNAQVINLSLASDVLMAPLAENPLNMAINAAGKMATMVVAAGNQKLATGTGMAEHAITVSSSNVWGNNLGVSFVNRGRYHETIVKPDLTAPGVDVRVYWNGAQKQKSGTSLSTAFVSGMVALLYEKFPGLTSEEYKALLQNSTTPVLTAPNPLFEGAGFPHLDKAIEAQFVANPGIVHFGWHTGLSRHETMRPFIVKNLKGQVLTGTIQVSSSVPGLAIEASKQAFSLAPKEATIVFLTLKAQENLSYPLSEPLIYSGEIIVEAAGQKIRVPWALIRAHRIEVEYAAPHSTLLLETGEAFTTMAPGVEVFAVPPAVKEVTIMSVLIKPQGLTATLLQLENNEPVKKIKTDAAQFVIPISP